MFVNKLRYTYTYEPLTFGDFVYSGNFGEIASIVKDTIFNTIWEILPIYCFLAVIFSFLTFIVSKFNIKANKNFKICRYFDTISIFSYIILSNKDS